MKKIKMVDVVTQYKKYSSEINKRILDVIESGCYIQGSVVKNFEKLLSNYFKSTNVISCANGTDALCIALMALDLKRGDEVLVPTFTFVSTVESVCFLGLKPIFLDVDPDTFLLNNQLIEKKISNKTKAIIPVHLFGQCCDMRYIKKIAKKHDLFIIEDAAQSIGSKCLTNSSKLSMKFSGTIGDIGITSFYPSKNLGCFGDGGALFTQNNSLAKRIRLLANHGQKLKYTHDIVGMNSRLDALQATVLSFKLTLLDDFNKRRQQVAVHYDDNLSDINWLKIPQKQLTSDHVYHQYSILLSPSIERNKFQKHLLNNGIPSMIYYPTPLHKQKAYNCYVNESLPVAEKLSKQIISLPMHSELESKEVDFICKIIQNFN